MVERARAAEREFASRIAIAVGLICRATVQREDRFQACWSIEVGKADRE